ncbi:MAG: hypothetical protein KGZ67_12230 [Hydrogenophaga sp.]|nr:hypothetical protein [Hydrogenophaga sp.]
MQHDLFSSIESFQASFAPAGPLLVRDTRGQYRPAAADEVLLTAQQLLDSQVRGGDVMDSSPVGKDFLRTRLGHLPHEVFAVVHLDSQNRVIDYVEMFRGTVSHQRAMRGPRTQAEQGGWPTQASGWPADVIAAARTPRQSLRLGGTAFAEPTLLRSSARQRFASVRRGEGSACARQPTRLPHPQVRGTCGGSFSAMGL